MIVRCFDTNICLSFELALDISVTSAGYEYLRVDDMFDKVIEKIKKPLPRACLGLI